MKVKPYVLVALWLYIDMHLLTWCIILSSINFSLLQVTLLSWKLVYKMTRLAFKTMFIKLRLQNDILENQNCNFPTGPLEMWWHKELLLCWLSWWAKRCKHNSLSLMRNRTTQTKIVSKAWLESISTPGEVHLQQNQLNHQEKNLNKKTKTTTKKPCFYCPTNTWRKLVKIENIMSLVNREFSSPESFFIFIFLHVVSNI